MSPFNRLTAVLMTAAMVGPLAPLEAKTHKGDRFYAEGKVHEVKKEWDAALESYQKALEEDPADMLYQIGCDRARFSASQMHVDQGLKIRSQGRLGEALLEFQRAYVINPGSIIAGQELAATNAMILRERQRVQETGKESPPEIRALTPYEEAKRKESQRFSRLLGVPELKPLDPNPFDVHLSGQKAMKVFETIGSLAGINVLFDPEYVDSIKPFPVELQRVTVGEALDYVAIVTKSYWKPLSANTILVINDNQNKRRDYEELVTKVFYLQNATQPSEVQEMQQILRTGCDIQRVFPYNSGFALIVRGESDRVQLCEKLIRDVDKPKSEVLIDILVMDATSSFNRQITAAIASTGLNIPVTFSPRQSLQVQGSSTTTTTGTTSTTGAGSTYTGSTGTTGATTTGSSSTSGTQIPLSNLGHISSADFATTLPGALLQAAMSDTRSKVLQAPQIRAVDNLKAVMNIGERVPVASGSFQPGVGGIGINPLVNTQFTYQDVGVNVELLARVLEGNEVYMHLKIDVSEIDGYQSQGGIQEPIIGQRKIEQDLRVKEGEVALIGGVIKQQNDFTVTGIPGLMKIPILGKLFSGRSSDFSRDDLMIVMIPHIIRRPEYTPDNLRAVATGTQAAITLRLGPSIPVDGNIPGTVNYSPAAPEASTIPSMAAPPVNAPPATAPILVPPATAPPATAPPATSPPPAAAAGSGEGDKPQLTARVRLNPSRMETRVSSTVVVSVVIEGGNDVASAPMTIRFDPKMLRLNDVMAGDFLGADGQTPIVTKNIQNDSGQAVVMLSRPLGLPGVSGPGGVLANLSFQTIRSGSTTVGLSNISVRNSQGQMIANGSPEMTLSVH